MTTGPDNRNIPYWRGYRRLSNTDDSFTITFSSVDASGTWTGKARQFKTDSSTIDLTVTVVAAYGGTDTTVTVTLDGDEIDALLGDDAEYPCWLGAERSDGVYGIGGEVLFENKVTRS